MSDLIRRSDVMETLEKVFRKYYISWNPNGKREGEFDRDVPAAIMNIPVAYDVDKVVEKMKSEEICLEDNYGDDVLCIPSDVVLNIAKTGGMK